jgi:hypothetical protein
MAAAPPPTNPCSRLPREQRAACKREQALALQRRCSCGWVQARRRSLQALLNQEAWQSRTVVGELLADPVWQLA